MIVNRYISADRPLHTLVHVGAHSGQELDIYEQLPLQRVVWIEAADRAFADLKARVEAEPRRLEHVCLNALVTDVDGAEIAFHEFSNKGASNSVFGAAPKLTETWPNVREVRKTLMRSTRLDTLLEDAAVEPQDVEAIVVDVQGAEMLVLKGAGRYLDHVGLLEVEASTEPIYEGGVLFPELDTWITDKGFRRVSGFKWHGSVCYARNT